MAQRPIATPEDEHIFISPANCTGPECRVCTADGVCGSGQACRKALPMYRKLEGACRVGTKGFADFLGGAGRVMLSMAMPGAYTD